MLVLANQLILFFICLDSHDVLVKLDQLQISLHSYTLRLVLSHVEQFLSSLIRGSKKLSVAPVLDHDFFVDAAARKMLRASEAL